MNFNIFAFPFEQIGWMLRQLSLSGMVGNIIAIVIYVALSLIPCVVGVVLMKKGKCIKMDIGLPILSIFLFFLFYYMINPGLFVVPVPGSGKTLLGCTFYSLLVGYLVLRVLARTKDAGMESLQKGLRILLYGVMILFAVLVIVELFYNLPQAIRSIKEDNSMNEVIWESEGIFSLGMPGLTTTYIFLVLQGLLNALPYVLDMGILFLAIKAIDALLQDAYSDEAVAAVQKIGIWCSKALAIVVIAGVVFNVAQLLFRNSLCQIDVTTTIPLFSILFILAILVMARFVGENQKLKQDNDLFI